MELTPTRWQRLRLALYHLCAVRAGRILL